MTKEALTDKPDLEPMAIGLAATFLPRRDPYARHLEGAGHMCSSIFAEGRQDAIPPYQFFLHTAHLPQFLFPDHLHPQRFGLLVFRAGGFAQHQVAGVLADRIGDLAAVLFDEFLHALAAESWAACR